MAETAVRFYIADASCEPSALRGRKESSIDTEPRTLNQGELHSARKAAVEIMQKKEPEEARTIFTKGLRPVRSMKEMESLLQSQTPLIEKQPQGFHLQWSKSLQGAPCCECQYLRGRRLKNKIEGPSSAPF